jgi:hypothetical protein
MTTTDTTQAVRVPVTLPSALQPDSRGYVPNPETAEFTAVFTAPDGSLMPVKVTMFQIGHRIGVGIYPTDRKGVVARWDNGITEKPRIVHWNQDGPPCR